MIDHSLAHLPKLNIGAGTQAYAFPESDGWINSDILPGDAINIVFDACRVWPFKANTISRVYASHVLEHLVDHMAFFREAWRVLHPLGTMSIRVPSGSSMAAWADFTHVRPWYPESFGCLQPGFIKNTRNLVEHEDVKFAFWVKHVVVILERSWARWFRFSFLRSLFYKIHKSLFNVSTELMVDLHKAPLDDPRSTAFGGSISPLIVPVLFGAYRHHMLNVSCPESGIDQIITWGTTDHREL